MSQSAEQLQGEPVKQKNDSQTSVVLAIVYNPTMFGHFSVPVYFTAVSTLYLRVQWFKYVSTSHSN